MKLGQEDVAHVAELAKLALTDAEKETYRAQLSAILDYFEKLQQVDTSDIAGTTSVLALENVLRKDVVQSSLPREEISPMRPAVQSVNSVWRRCWSSRRVIVWA